MSSSSTLQMDVRGCIICGHTVTVESLIRISTGTIFSVELHVPWLQDPGEGMPSASIAQLWFNHLASQELAPRKMWTHCAGADLLDVTCTCHKTGLRCGHCQGESPGQPSHHFHGFYSFTNDFQSLFFLAVIEFVIIHCWFYLKNFEEFSYF